MTSMSEWANSLQTAAENFARDVDPRGLDFTVRSLERLDQVLVRATQKPDLFKKAFTGMWAYLGEVLVRQYGCRWGTEDGQDATRIGDLRLLPPTHAAPGAQPLQPMELLERRFARRVAVHELIIEIATSWFSQPVAAPTSDGVAEMHTVAEVFVATAKGAGAMWVDYSPESVLRLDDFIDDGWGAKPRRGTYEALIPTIGAYVGEVLVAQTGARWIRTEDGAIAVELGRLVMYPMNKVAKRFERGREHSIAHFYREIVSHWASGSEDLPATWQASKPEEPKRGLFGFGRR